MAWTERSTELLVTGIVGILGTLLGALFVGLGSRAFQWWDHRQKLKNQLRKYRVLLAHSSSPSYISDQLKSLKLFLLENETLLERPSVRCFFDTWLQEDLSGETGHSKFITHGWSKNLLPLQDGLNKLHW